MIFKRFDFRVLVRVITFTALIASGLISLLKFRFEFTALVLFFLAFIGIIELIYFVSRTNRIIARYFTAALNNDTSVHFSDNTLKNGFPTLFDSMNQLTAKLKAARIEKENQFRFFNLMIQQINVGIIAVDEEGTILQMNRMAEELLGVPAQKNWTRLSKMIPQFTQAINLSNTQSSQLIVWNQNGKETKLSTRITTLDNLRKSHWLLSIQDINQELESQEIEAWHKLIRVLTHEIVNSITPIYSLSETSNLLVEALNKASDHEKHEVEDRLKRSISTIQMRSQGLLRFIKDYRKITEVPTARMETITIGNLISRLIILMKPEFTRNNIILESAIQNVNLKLNIDAQLIEQVLINVLVNAKDAVEHVKNATVNVETKSTLKTLFILVKDNGPGIEKEDLDQIFTPFYTTKANGNGIGLSLSRNIMRMHNGSINYKRVEGLTVFTLELPIHLNVEV